MYRGNHADTGDRRILARRIVVWSIAFFVLCILQCSFFARLKPFGAVPDITLGALCGVFMLDNKWSASICALGAGYFIDALGAVAPSFSPLFYILAVAVIGALSEKMMPRFLSFAVLLIPASALKCLFTYLEIWVYMGARPALSCVTDVLLPEFISTVVVCLPIYFVIKLCVIPIEAKGRFSF